MTRRPLLVGTDRADDLDVAVADLPAARLRWGA